MEILIVAGAAVIAGTIAWMARGRVRALQPAHNGNVEAAPTRRERGDGHHPDGRKEARTAPAPSQPAADTAEELVRLRERLEQELAERRAEIGRLEERILQREESLERRLGETDSRERSLNDRELDARAQVGGPGTGERGASARARARRRDEPYPGQARAGARAGGGGPPRRRARCAAARGGGAPRFRAPRAQHPLGRHAAACGGARDGDHGVGRAASVRRHERAHHRPRGPEHPGAREHHRSRLHHRRHPLCRRAVRFRRRCAARSRS